MSHMTIQESQKIVADWIKSVGVGYFSEMTQLAQLTEEVGQAAPSAQNEKRIGKFFLHAFSR